MGKDDFIQPAREFRRPTQSIKKRKKEDTFSHAFFNHGAFANARPTAEVSSTSSVAADVRMKNYEQLRYAKQLNLDGILTDTEFEEQKENILVAIKELYIVS